MGDVQWLSWLFTHETFILVRGSLRDEREKNLHRDESTGRIPNSLASWLSQGIRSVLKLQNEKGKSKWKAATATQNCRPPVSPPALNLMTWSLPIIKHDGLHTCTQSTKRLVEGENENKTEGEAEESTKKKNPGGKCSYMLQNYRYVHEIETRNNQKKNNKKTKRDYKPAPSTS